MFEMSAVNLARCHSDYGKLQIRLQLHKSDSYSEYIEKLPERIKQIFRKKATCSSCRSNCHLPLYRTFEGIEYIDCGYGNYFDMIHYIPDDIMYYQQIIQYEIKAVKKRK